ncbi:MAG: transporter substrate-binding domain-containing protein [Actinomycetota bacterium]|nr:transporter substrate-binding domain-containing protein [Actinomycetota bacterium]
MPVLRRPLRAAPAVLALVAAAACSGSSQAASRTCTPAKLATKQAGTLTLSTGKLTSAPWVVGGAAIGRSNDPRLGKGYDAAVGYALATHLGYDDKQVRWVGTSFADSISAGAKSFDVSINQATITDPRRKDVDLSTPYWVVRDAVVTIKGRPLADVTTLQEMKGFPLATVTVDHRTAPTGVTLIPFATYDELRRSVVAGTQQGLITSYTAALRIARSGTEIADAKMAAALPTVKGAEGYGLVLEKGSPLTSCVDGALAAMRKDGTLDELEQRWLIEEPGLHILR